MDRYILIITSSIDCTVDYIIQTNKNTKFFRLNVDCINEYDLYIGNKQDVWIIKDLKNNITLFKNNVISIYFRKPMFPDLSIYDDSYHSMIQKDILALINGIADTFDGKVLSRPCILRLSENKISQLIFSINNNFLIPESFIGNSNETQKEFNHFKSIIKPITTGKVYTESECELYQTSYFKFENDDISLTPVYLQKYIEKKYEVRITIINSIFYTVRIDTMNKLDWRKDYDNHKYMLIECPEKIKQQCLAMLKYFNLDFGAFDYIVTPDNDWVFLEVNPNGQWLWLEESLNLDISKQIVQYLLEK